MAIIYIDRQPHEANERDNLLHTCLRLGFDLPYFCWHPALNSVGACRQCAIKLFRNEQDTRGRIVMACMTPASPETRISIEDPEAKEFRRSVIEFLMANHPHDCPVCDEGGECHLQDMTLMTGHVYRRFGFDKRTHRNQYLGPLVNHEMNRCIACYRCTRFYRNYAGGHDLNVFNWHDHVYFGREEDGVLESEFSGNLVEVCPTGVFTDRTLKQHYARKWDLQTAPSVCVHCSLGCNTIPGERYGSLRRIRNRYNPEVNGYFLCDRGRYGYGFVNSNQRARHPILPLHETPKAITGEAALVHAAVLLHRRDRLIGVGSPRASLEANFALRTLVGAERFHLGMSDEEMRLVTLAKSILQTGPARSPSLRDVQQADAIFLLGEDVTQTAPVLALALRQAVFRKNSEFARSLGIHDWDDASLRQATQQKQGPFWIATPYPTRLDGLAEQTFRAVPDEIARLGFAVAHFLDSDATEALDLPAPTRDLAQHIAGVLREARRPLVVAGTHSRSEAVLQAAAHVAWALCRRHQPAELCLTFPECNSFGLALMDGKPLSAAFHEFHEGRADTLVILENDLYHQISETSADALMAAADHVLVIDHLVTTTGRKAELLLPCSTFAESQGSFVNNEGRAQRFYKVFAPSGEIQESWRWLRDLMVAAGHEEGGKWANFSDIAADMATTLPVFEKIPQVAPPSDFRIAGQKIARQPHRYSGRTAMLAHINVHEPKPPEDPDSPFAFSMEGYNGKLPPPFMPRIWAPGWNSEQALQKYPKESSLLLKYHPDVGERLIEPEPERPIVYFKNPPEAFQIRQGEWLLIPLYHIFGSEPLSALSDGINELTPKPYLGLPASELLALEAVEGDILALHIGASTHEFPVRAIDSLPKGAVGIPMGLPGIPRVDFPQWGTLQKLKS